MCLTPKQYEAIKQRYRAEGITLVPGWLYTDGRVCVKNYLAGSSKSLEEVQQLALSFMTDIGYSFPIEVTNRKRRDGKPSTLYDIKLSALDTRHDCLASNMLIQHLQSLHLKKELRAHAKAYRGK